jgi:hypothetical protein
MAEKYAKNVLGEKDVESVLLRLDRLSFDESRPEGDFCADS